MQSETSERFRVCKTCGESKPFSDYYSQPRCRDGIRLHCKRCEIASQVEYGKRPEVAERRRQWARENRVRDPEVTARDRMWTWHRIRPEQFNAILEAQGGVCAICGAPEPGGKGRWHVDHDHACCPGGGGKTCGGCVRGILCHHCNLMIGQARDSIERLTAAAEYLRRASVVR